MSNYDFELRLSPDLQRLLHAGSSLTNVHGTVSNNVEYIWALEYGHSGQAPEGMIRRNLNAFGYMVDEEIQAGFDTYGATDIRKAILAGTSTATLRVMRAIADKTPVDTGRAKGGWTATLPGTIGPGGGGAIINAKPEALATVRSRREARKRDG